jgi:O-acetylserine/cysteine efflux transporter
MPRRHAVLALVVAVCWAVNFVVIEIGLESFPPLLFAALRFGLIAFPAIFFVPRPDVRWPAVVAVGLFICVGQFGVLFVAMNIGLPAGLASVIAPLQPVFTIPLAVVVLGERPTRRQVVGVAVAVLGLGAIAAGRAHGVPLLAVVLGVASAASWGCGNVVTRAAGPKRPFSLLVWSSLVAPVPLLGLSLAFEGVDRWQSAASSVGASGVAALAYVVIVSTFFGYGMWYRMLSRYPASTVAPFTLLVPVVGIITAWLARDERPTWGELAGSFVVLVGLGLALVQHARSSRVRHTGELHRDAEPTGLARREREGPVVRAGDALDDREPEADARVVGSAAFAAAEKRLDEGGDQLP